MPLKPQTLDFMRQLERSSNRKLSFPDDVGNLLEAARQSQCMDAFEEAIFLAKFITKSAGVMQRIGPDGEGYDKLAAGVQTGIQKSSTLLQTISGHTPEGVRTKQSDSFFAINHEALERLMQLFADLTLVKNWMLDGKPLP
jgi:hypothetical protein